MRYSQLTTSQIDCVLDDLDVRAMKTGMLLDEDIIKAVVKSLNSRFSGRWGSRVTPPLVCDPVCVSTSGHQLLHPDALDVMISEIFPLSSLITPNKSEAELLLSRTGQACQIDSVESMLDAAGKLQLIGSEAVLLKGGHIKASLADIDRISKSFPNVKIVKQHLPHENMEILLVDSPDYNAMTVVVDVLHQSDDQQTLFVRPRIDSSSTHGTGCTLSAAIACGLAKGSPCAPFAGLR